jgi:hypothetical protein
VSTGPKTRPTPRRRPACSRSCLRASTDPCPPRAGMLLSTQGVTT